jgi:hypothetical protein
MNLYMPPQSAGHDKGYLPVSQQVQCRPIKLPAALKQVRRLGS